MAKVYIVSERDEFGLREKIERGIFEHSHTLVLRNYLPVGTYDDQIEEKLKEADVIIILFTPNSLKEDYFKIYLERVKKYLDRKLIIPIFLDSIKQEEAPQAFRNLIGISLQSRADEYLASAIITIASAISKFLKLRFESEQNQKKVTEGTQTKGASFSEGVSAEYLGGSNIELMLGDIFDQTADLLVIPRSTAGTISKPFKKGLEKFNYKYKGQKESELGSIHLEENFVSSNFRMLAFATSVHNHTSTVEAIHTLSENLANLSNEYKFKNIALPMFETGSGHLDPLKAYTTFTNSFSSYSSNETILKIVVYDQSAYNVIKRHVDNIENQGNVIEEGESGGSDNKSSSSDYSESEQPISNPTYNLNKILSNDVWAQKDKLGYECYAKLISEMIKEESVQTKPPLTIAILAPWGQGKTTLMRYIERNLKEARHETMRGKENVKELKI